MRIRAIILSTLILISVCTQGQSEQYELTGSPKPNSGFVTGELYNGNLQADTYLDPDWTEGDLLLVTGEKINNVLLRYNGLTDELFWKEPVADKIIKVDKESVKGFHFNDFRGDTTVYFKRMKIKKDYVSDSAFCFLQEIDFSRIRLYIYHSKFFLKRETYSLNRKTSIRDVYIEEPVWFIESGSKLSVFRKVTRKALIAAYPDKSEMIKKYFRNSASGRIRTSAEMISFCLFVDQYL